METSRWFKVVQGFMVLQYIESSSWCPKQGVEKAQQRGSANGSMCFGDVKHEQCKYMWL